MSSLTDQQLDVLRLLAAGRTYGEICSALGWESTGAVHDVAMQLRARNCVHGRPREPVVSSEGRQRLDEAGLRSPVADDARAS